MADKLFLFDMDGVLFDTMPQHVRSWKQALEAYGIEVEQDEFYLYEGMRGVDTINKLYTRTYDATATPELIDEIYQKKTSLFNSGDSEFRLIPFTKEVIAHLKSKGYDIGVVTGSTKQNALPRIEKYYGEYISLEHVVTADSVERGKPFPDPYVMGMKLFDRTPSETIVVENAPLGVRSAASAGALTIAVTTGPIKEYILREEGAKLVFMDMKALLLWCYQLK